MKKKNPIYTSLSVITKGTIIKVKESELSLVTPARKVVWGRYSKVMNNLENDWCINAVLLVKMEINLSSLLVYWFNLEY
jgi:ribosome biogenesis protein NSA2